jgi:anti-sigma factor RsiW
MRCEEAEALLDLHLDNELPQELAVKVDRHLLRCARCAGDLRSLEQTRELLREAVPPAEPSPGYRERASARLHDRLAGHLRKEAESEAGRQWILPFP